MAAKATQVTLYMKTREQGKSQVEAAARAGISERTTRRVDAGSHCSHQPVGPNQLVSKWDTYSQAGCDGDEVRGNFINADRDTDYLFPPSMQDWLPEEHLARFVVEVVDPLDLSELTRQYAGRG